MTIDTFDGTGVKPSHWNLASVIDMALWDLAGKLLKLPVSKLLGGNFRDEVEVYSTDVMSTFESDFRSQIKGCETQGANVIVIVVFTSVRPMGVGQLHPAGALVQPHSQVTVLVAKDC